MKRTAARCLQRSRLHVGNLICVSGGIVLCFLTWIFAHRAMTIAQQMSASPLPGQVPTLVEISGQYHQAAALCTICFLMGAALLITGLMLVISAEEWVQQQRVISQFQSLASLAVIIVNLLALMAAGLLIFPVLGAWFAIWA